MREKLVDASAFLAAMGVLYLMIASVFGWIVGAVAWVIFLVVWMLRARTNSPFS